MPPSNTTILLFIGDFSATGAKVVHLSEGGFDWANSLKELYFDGIVSIYFARGAFRGLTNLRVLNMSGCTDVFYHDFLQAFQGYNTFSKLEVLVLSSAGNQVSKDNFKLDNSFTAALAHTKLKYLDVSDMVIDKYNISDAPRYLPHLQCVNISGIEIINRSISDGEIRDRSHIPSVLTIDASRIMADKTNKQNRIFCKIATVRIYSSYYLNITNFLSQAITTLILNNVCGDGKGRTFENIRNVTISGQSVLKRFYARENNFPIVDIEANFEVLSNIELIDLSSNGIQFLNNNTFSSLKELNTFLLADNQLGNMAKTHNDMFTQMFAKFVKLAFLDLSRNDIATIPNNLFLNNHYLVDLDLSGNMLTKLTFKCDHLHVLERLYLRGNRLTTLDINARMTLGALPKTTNVTISDNAFTCSKCDDYDTIRWLIQHAHILDLDNLKCKNEIGKSVPVTQTIQKDINDVCEKPLKLKIKISVTVGTAIILCIITIATVYIIIKRRTNRRQSRKRLNTITKLNDGRLEFLVFLIYSSKDEDFVHTSLYPLLNQHLHRIIPIEEDMIAFGDKDFRVGKSILDETIRCTKSSATVVLLLTDNFVSSDYCLQEFDVAFRVGKPVILMLKGDVDMARAPPVIRDLFHSYVRVLWKQGDNGEYFLTTSWENVCNAILESG
ncbi:hypothetical protein DPMN_107689 [Dreissena polymorpha]|uniref:TIR domain-containing protein n=1 Tax=Dreissena polymorpha TaxID=45954 RepID=A0A9D4K771_DREPO|nr:hypothetical protein DPMN_107689 [Dreissena polymorpha]